MKRKNNNVTAIALSMAAGAAIGAIGATQFPKMTQAKFTKKAKKNFKKTADKALNTAQNIIDAIPRYM